jgi:hypothetical protein
LKADTGEKVETLVSRLVEHFKSSLDDESIVTCDHCNADSDTHLPDCPFCGLGNGATELAEEVAKSQEKALLKKNGSNGANGSNGTNGHATHHVAEIIDAPVKVSLQSAQTIQTLRSLPIGEDRLNKALIEYFRLVGIAAMSYWQMGRFIHDEFYDNKLWKQRRNEKGRPAYVKSGFENFVKTELGFSVKKAMRLMDVAKKFTEEQVNVLGYSRLLLLAPVPESEIPDLIEVAKKVTVRELEKEVRAVMKGKTPDRPVKRHQPREKVEGSGRKKTVSEEGMITIASIVGRKTIPLYAQGKSGTKKFKLATASTVSPWGKLELENNVTMAFSVQVDPKGNLVLLISTARNDD